MSSLFNPKKTKYDFVAICKMDKDTLKAYLAKELNKYMTTIYNEDGYVYAPGTIPVLVTAHMDTVHKEIVQKINYLGKGDRLTVSSPQGIGGDDRCGIWMILELLRAGYKPYVLFCEEEEIGGIGSKKFCHSNHIKDLKESQIKYMIELDRANANDAVFYDCGNEEFKDWICKKTGYVEAYGSFSDICHLSPELDLAAVNLSCGYYKAHTTNEYVVLSEMHNTLNKVKALMEIDYKDMKSFNYQEITYNYSNYSYGNYFGHYYDGYNYWGSTGSNGSTKSFNNSFKSFKEYWYIVYTDLKGNVMTDEYQCDSYYEALGMWCFENPDLSFDCVYDVLDEDSYWDSEYTNVELEAK